MQVTDVSSALKKFDALTAKHFVNYACAANVYSARADLDELTRVIDVDVLALDPTYSLLDPAFIDAKKPTSGVDDKFSDDLNIFVESLSGDPAAIRPGATLRSSLPFSWAAPSAELTRKLSSQAAAALADKFRDLLATPHYPGKNYLYRLNYPPKSGAVCGVHRPTAFEAGSQPYFRARTDGADLCGRTVNLDHFGVGLPTDEGVPEVLVPVLLVTTEMSWQSLGAIMREPANPDDAAHERSLHPSQVISAVAQAITILDGA